MRKEIRFLFYGTQHKLSNYQQCWCYNVFFCFLSSQGYIQNHILDRTCQYTCFYYRGINPLNTEKLDEYLKANLTVIAMWSNKECTTCDLEIFTMYKMIYWYQDYEKVLFFNLLECRLSLLLQTQELILNWKKSIELSQIPKHRNIDCSSKVMTLLILTT